MKMRHIREKSITWYTRKYWKPALAVGMSVAVLGSVIAFGGAKDEPQVNIQEPVKTLPVSELQAFTPLEDVPLDAELQEFIFGVAEDYGLDGELVMAMIGQESNYKHCEIGDNGESFGLMQIQPRWHQARMDSLFCPNLLNPYQNVTVGIDYLAELFDTGNSLEWVLMAYNSGPSNAYKNVASGRVSQYAKTVLLYYKNFNTLKY